MKSRSAKNKGKRLQNQVRDLLLEKFQQLEEDDVRSTTMGDSGEDILLSPAARKLFPFSVECKNEDSMEQIRNAINNLKDSESKNIIVENYAPVGLRVTFAMGRSRSMDKTKKCFLNGITCFEAYLRGIRTC